MMRLCVRARPLLARLAWLLVTWCAFVAVCNWALWHFDLGLQPASVLWPLAIAGAASFVGLSAVASLLVPRPSVFIEIPGARVVPRFIPVLRTVGTLAVLIGLAAGSFGIGALGTRDGEDRWAVFIRRDRLFEPQNAAGHSEDRPSSYYVTSSPAVQVLDGVRSIRVYDEDRAASAFASGPSGNSSGWIRVGKVTRWPLRFPPDRLLLNEVSSAIAARIRWPNAPARSGQLALNLAEAVPSVATHSGLARTAIEQWWSNPVGPEVAWLMRVRSATPSLFAGGLYRIRPGSLGLSAGGDALVTTAFHVPNSGHRLYRGQVVFESGQSGLTPRFRYNWGDDEPFDLLGESGDCVSPERLLTGCLLTWRSRSVAAPGVFALPEESARSKACSCIDLPFRRAVSADAADANTARVARILGIVMAILLLMHVVGVLRGV
jgi:hypothetical protein